MQQTVFTMEDIAAMVKPLADKYRVKQINFFHTIFICSARMREGTPTKIAIWIFWFSVGNCFGGR